MIVKYMGKLLYPHLAPSQRRHEMRMLILAAFIAITFASVMVAVILVKNLPGR